LPSGPINAHFESSIIESLEDRIGLSCLSNAMILATNRGEFYN